MYHNPVLLNDSIAGLCIQPTGVYADLTFGGGGHTRAILDQLGDGRVVAFDQDEEAHQNRIDDKRLSMVRGNFRYLTQYLRFMGALPVDGILADLGISSHHIDAGERGFSTRFDASLDMRMDRARGQNAADLINSSSPEELASIFRELGELPNSAKLARHIVQYRSAGRITTTEMLKEAAIPFAPLRQEHKFFAQLFQAIRIAVNDEINALKEMLLQTAQVLRPGGRLVIISYHSLEDRLVKHYMRSGNLEDKKDTDFFGQSDLPYKVITRKAIVPSAEEMTANSRARSAKLRIAERN